MLADVALVAGKDLRVELRSRIAVNQIAPFAFLVLILFGFALDADRAALTNFTPGLYWLAIMLSAVLAVHRSVAVESGDGAQDGLLMSSVDPIAIFLGKCLALMAQLALLAVVLLGGVVVLYEADIEDPALIVASTVVALGGIAAAGTLYGALLSGQRVRETVLPMLLLPVLAPVLISATRAFGDAMGTTATNGWSWLLLLVAFTALYVLAGVFGHPYLMEDA